MYLTFVTKLKKSSSNFLIVAFIMFNSNSYCRCVYCFKPANRPVICFFSTKSCAAVNIDFRSGNPGCLDYKTNSQTSGSNFLIKEKGGLASISIDGSRIQIASDMLESFLESKIIQTNADIKAGVTMKMVTEKFQEELELFLKTDNKKVSYDRLREISADMGIPINIVGCSELPSALIKINPQNNDEKNAKGSLTDNK